jgi:hypothetical protein
MPVPASANYPAGLLRKTAAKVTEQERREFIWHMERMMGRPLTRQEINFAILQAANRRPLMMPCLNQGNDHLQQPDTNQSQRDSI